MLRWGCLQKTFSSRVPPPPMADKKAERHRCKAKRPCSPISEGAGRIFFHQPRGECCWSILSPSVRHCGITRQSGRQWKSQDVVFITSATDLVRAIAHPSAKGVQDLWSKRCSLATAEVNWFSRGAFLFRGTKSAIRTPMIPTNRCSARRNRSCSQP